MLTAIVRKELQLDASLYTCLRILSVSVFEKTPLFSTLQTDGAQIERLDNSSQLFLFEF